MQKSRTKNKKSITYALPEKVDYTRLADKILPLLLSQILHHRGKYFSFSDTKQKHRKKFIEPG